ncbi:MAG: chaperone NapD [Burkholderiaceae bacterium]
MNYSGIAVLAEPTAVPDVVDALRALPGVEVHQVDAATGRIVVVQEAEHVDAEMAGFASIRSLAGVVSADLVCHYFGDGDAPPPDPDAAIARLENLQPGRAS